MEKSPPFQQRKRMTRLGEVLARQLVKQKKPLLSNYEIFRFLWEIYEAGGVKYLRGETPTKEIFRRTRQILRSEGLIRQDSDYTSLWRVMSKPDAPAEDIICSIDPYCYISHLSAMQRYGLTNRRPEALYLTLLQPPIKRQLLVEQMKLQYGNSLILHEDEIEPPRAISHPPRVRGRKIEFEAKKKLGDHIAIKGSFSQIATVGQTFLDMLDRPDNCGGMAHILDVYSEHARTYLDEIVAQIDQADKPILKIRGGYILDHGLGIEDDRIESWVVFAQRGSSRVLSPGKPFSPEYSDKWMLSLNV